ncbi:MAG: hypothetical protein PF503_05400 [Desulfobacula sp.]|jgi:hypothetical protein|nr:hypothetical protein [Desulfobacula sp.]
MGGSGSGSWYRWDTKAKTESQHRVDIRWLKKQNYLKPGISGSLSWSSRGESTGSIRFSMQENNMILKYRHRPRGGEWQDVEQIISFDQTPCNYGGHRKWFLCPRCYKRVSLLYGAGKYFLCRHCHDLTYDTCNSSPLQRIFDKANKLRERIGGHAGLSYPIADRPKGMHHSTYIRIVAKIERLENLGDIGMVEKWGFGF